MAYWLFKTEPDTFSINHLKNAPESTTLWDGVRNYQARNFLRDEVKTGDRVFIYHSSCKEPGVVGIAEVVREAYPDPSQFDLQSDYYDAKASEEVPRWFSVDIRYQAHLPKPVSLQKIKSDEQISELPLKRAHRLSIMPVNEQEWTHICRLGGL